MMTDNLCHTEYEFFNFLVHLNNLLPYQCHMCELQLKQTVFPKDQSYVMVYFSYCLFIFPSHLHLHFCLIYFPLFSSQPLSSCLISTFHLYFPSIHSSIHVFIHPFIHPSIYPFIHPSIHNVLLAGQRLSQRSVTLSCC